MKKLVIILAGLIVVLFLALLVGPKLINWNSYKPRIIAMVKKSTGRELRIDGNVELSILPNLTFSVSGVHLANAPGMQAPEMLSLGAASGRLRLLPLLMRRVVVDSLIVQEPSVYLEVNKQGHANWEFAAAGKASPATTPEPSGSTTALPIKGLSLGDVHLSRGTLSMTNALTGQTLAAKDIDLKAALASLADPLTLALRLKLNEEPVAVDLSLDSPGRLLAGSAAGLQATVTSKYITTAYQGKMQQQPVPGLDGTFNLDIPSVGQLAAWLDRPLDRTQPDPGPLKVRAVFQGDGKTVAMPEATITGKALNAKASGRFDGSGEISRITLNVESDALDLDRYLPPPTTQKITGAQKGQAAQAPSRPAGDILAVFSPQPLDLQVLRKTEADVHIAIRGVKAMGYDIGQVDFTTNLKNGLLNTTVKQLAPDGGNINGKLQLDGSGKALDVKANLKIDRLKVDKFARAAGGKAMLTGIASGNLQATAKGESPRQLVENLQGSLTFDLAGVDLQNTPANALSALNIDLNLPGIDQKPTFKGHAVYNKQPITVNVSTDPLRQVLSNDAFTLQAAVDAALLHLKYDGKVQQRPVPGLDGAFNLDVPSAGKLADWLGQPLDKSQPDPGPLKVQALFQGEGAKIILKSATLEGQALKANASGSYDSSGDIARVTLKVDSEKLDIDRYLPPPTGQTGQLPKATKPAPRASNPLAALSDKPFDLGALKKMAVDAHIAIAGMRAQGYQIGRIAINTTLAKGLLTTEIKELQLYDGNVKGTLKLDGAEKKLHLDTVLTVAGVNLDELLKAATSGPPAASGIVSAQLNLNAEGVSPKAFVESVNGKVMVNLEGGKNKDASAISEMHVEADLPGLSKPSTIKGQVVYNKEPVQLDLQVDSIHKALVGDPFAVNSTVKSQLVNLAYDGKLLQKPAPGLDGTLNLDVSSLGRLMQWLEQPLPKEQPDPGPVKLHAVFEAKTSQATLKEATLSGKALQVKASGQVDQSGSIPMLTARVEVESADLNAYLPPAESSQMPAVKKPTEAQPKATGWSDAPLDLSAFSRANGNIDIKIDSLRYRELTIKPGHMHVTLQNGVLDAALDPLQIADGKIASKVHLDTSGKAASLDYQASIVGLDARPLLLTLANSGRLSGKTEFQLKATARGQSQKELVKSLNGNGQFKFLDGAIHGINLAATLRSAKSLGLDRQAAETQKTDFAELSGSFVIKNGVVENKDLKMLAPLVRLNGGGVVPMPERTIDYEITANLVKSLEGQGSKDAMVGIPIPIKITGPWDNIAYIVDWKAVLQDMASDPERLKNLPQDLRETGKSLGVDLPLPQLPSTGKSTSPLEQLQKQLSKEPPASTPPTTAPKTAPKKGAKQAEEKPAPAPTEPLKSLPNLFKR